MILQRSTPYDVDAPRPLPGIAPLDMSNWLLVDEAFAAQMAERARLLRDHRQAVLAVTDAGRAAADELLQFILDWLAENGRGYRISAKEVLRPDGATVPIDRADPMGTLGQIIQEDLCLLQKQGEEHVLVAAVLCFPASWRLADKIGRPLVAIHEPVPSYDGGVARRVQRLFDGVQEDRPLWRFNALSYADPDLFQPERRMSDYAADSGRAAFRYLRSERQGVLRLPGTRACVFSIHSYVMDKTARGGAQTEEGVRSRSIE